MTPIGRSRKLFLIVAALWVAAPRILAQEEGKLEPLHYWVVDDSTKILPGKDMRGESGPVELAGAGGETVAFQLVLESPIGLDRVRLKVSDLVSIQASNGPSASVPANRFEIFLETYIDCPEVDREIVTLGPGRYPDPLVPLWVDGPGTREVAHPLELPANQRRVLWVDIHIPRLQTSGRYEGTIDFELGTEEAARVPIVLERYGFDLPPRPSLAAWVPLNPARFAEREKVSTLAPQEALELAWSYFRMAHDHRFVTQSISIEPRITWDESTGALLTVDWTSYDLVHGPVLDGSLFNNQEAPSLWKVGGSSWWGARFGEHPYFGTTRRDQSVTAAHRRALIEYAREIRRHFDEKGWTRPELFMYMVDQADFKASPQLARIAAGYGEAVHESRANIRHMVATSPGAGPDTLGAVDIWAADGAAYQPREMQARQALGERAWFFQRHEPFVGGHALNHEGLGLRSWAWIAWRHRVDGVFLWSGNTWGRDPYREAVNWDAKFLGNGVLFYPGAMLPTIGFPAIRGPVASVRMKTLRRGLLDYEYFTLLRSLGGDPDPVVNRIIPSALNEDGREPFPSHPLWGKHGAWSHDAAEWDRTRGEIAREIEQRMIEK